MSKGNNIPLRQRIFKRHSECVLLALPANNTQGNIHFADVSCMLSCAKRLPQHCAVGRRGGEQHSAHKLQVIFDV